MYFMFTMLSVHNHHFCSNQTSLRMWLSFCVVWHFTSYTTHCTTAKFFMQIVFHCFSQMKSIQRSKTIEHAVCCRGGLSWHNSALFRATLRLQVAKCTLKGWINNAMRKKPRVQGCLYRPQKVLILQLTLGLHFGGLCTIWWCLKDNYFHTGQRTLRMVVI